MNLLRANQHRSDLETAFVSLRPHACFHPPDLDYLFLLFTNRCGSNYLAQAIASSGLINEAGECFNAETILHHVRQAKLQSVQDYFRLLPQLVTRNEWLCAKLAVEHVELLSTSGILRTILGRSHFILLERQDRLAQAISRCIAWQNHRWTSEHPASKPNSSLQYSRDAIEEQIREIRFANGTFYRFLTDIGKVPLHFTYEAFVAEPQVHLDLIAARIGLPRLTLDSSRIRIRRQSNDVNEAWRLRYLAGC